MRKCYCTIALWLAGTLAQGHGMKQLKYTDDMDINQLTSTITETKNTIPETPDTVDIQQPHFKIKY